VTIPDPHGTKNQQTAWLIINGWAHDGTYWASRKRRIVTASTREACDVEIAAQDNEQLQMAEAF
jgi:hypothetical protein